MADHPGHLWELVQEWLDTFRYDSPPSQRKLAKALKVSNSSITDYKFARSMPRPEFIVRLAAEMQVPYEKVLDAVLQDCGYRGRKLTFIQDLVSDETASAESVEDKPAATLRKKSAS